MKEAPDLKIEIMANAVLGLLLSEFSNPQDVASVLALIHHAVIIRAFLPDQKAQAEAAVDGHATIVKELLSEVWT